MSATPLGNAYDKTATKHPAERKLVGVVLNELNPTAVNQRDKQYA